MELLERYPNGLRFLRVIKVKVSRTAEFDGWLHNRDWSLGRSRRSIPCTARTGCGPLDEARRIAANIASCRSWCE